jgi:hypothetical protein
VVAGGRPEVGVQPVDDGEKVIHLPVPDLEIAGVALHQIADAEDSVRPQEIQVRDGAGEMRQPPVLPGRSVGKNCNGRSRRRRGGIHDLAVDASTLLIEIEAPILQHAGSTDGWIIGGRHRR